MKKSIRGHAKMSMRATQTRLRKKHTPLQKSEACIMHIICRQGSIILLLPLRGERSQKSKIRQENSKLIRKRRDKKGRKEKNGKKKGGKGRKKKVLTS